MSADTYDYIVIGAGTAGCVIAHRLTEEAAVRVLLLEAGDADRDPLIHIPLGLGKLWDERRHDWGFDTEPQPGANGRRLPLPRGKVLGGSSSINAMAYVRGGPGDYDRWARNGATGWSFADVLPYFKRTDTAVLAAVKTEVAVWSALEGAVREPIAVCCTPSCGGMFNVRVSLRQRVPGEARNAIAAVFGSIADVKHVFVVDADIDVYSDESIDWALATRFQADRDFVLASGFRVVPLDPSLEGARVGAKAGLDCTKPFGKADSVEYLIPVPPELQARPQQSVEAALLAGPHTYLELIESIGSRDGREVAPELDRLDQAGRLARLPDGRYCIK